MPVLWNNLPKTVEEDPDHGIETFFCIENQIEESEFAVLPGVCGNEPEGFVSVANTTHHW